MCYAAFYPFRFAPENQVSWLQSEPGIVFTKRSIGYSERPFSWEEAEAPRAISIEFWVKPENEPYNHLGHILQFSDGQVTSPLVIAQWKSGLVLRSRLNSKNSRKTFWEMGVRGALTAGDRHFVTITSGPEEGTTIYVDGAPQNQNWNHTIISEGEVFGGHLLLGCSATGAGPFYGELIGLGIYDRVLSDEDVKRHWSRVQETGLRPLTSDLNLKALYPMDEGGGNTVADLTPSPNALSLPESFSPLRRGLLELPNGQDRTSAWFFNDLVRNVAGFLPFGFFLTLISRKERMIPARSVLILVTLAGFGFSMAIELIQVLLPARHSSVTDVAFNTVGAIFGVLCALLWYQRTRGDVT
jgi:VanZ family protein